MGLDAIGVIDAFGERLASATDAEHRTAGRSLREDRLVQTPGPHPLQIRQCRAGPRQHHRVRPRDDIRVGRHPDIDTEKVITSDPVKTRELLVKY